MHNMFCTTVKQILARPLHPKYFSICSALSSNDVPTMPPCSVTPEPYKGLPYDEVLRRRQSNLVPCLVAHYKKPLLIHQGKMQWLFDHTGKRYLDMFAGIVTVSVGHCHPKVNAALAEQANRLWHTTTIYMYPKLYEYVEALVSKLPGDLKVAYLVNSGSEANELAMLMARLYTGNFDIISLRNGYHGGTPVVMGITALSNWRFNVPIQLGIHHATNPDVYQGIWGGSHCRDSPVQTDRKCKCSPGECKACDMYFSQLEDIFKYSLPRGGKLAGFIAESIQGVGGTVQFPKGYLKKSFDLVRSKGGVCISDEVQTGFGRTGEHYWGFEMHGVVPDIVTLAKGIGNGFPLGAVVTTPAIAESLSRANHFNTYGGNPMASAAGLAVLQVIDEENIQKNALEVGTHLLLKLSKLRDEFGIVGDVRGKGLMIGVEMVTDNGSRNPLPAMQMADIWEDCKDMGLLVGKGGLYGNVFRMKPPMCVTKEDADFAVAVMRKALQNFTRKNNLKN